MLLRWLPLALITLVAFCLRTRELERRPMHADEANQAVKLGELLDAGRYAFDPRDHHGPSLYYAAVPIAWLRGERSLATLTETTVRLVPALFGTAAVVLLAFVGSGLSRLPSPRDLKPVGGDTRTLTRVDARPELPPRKAASSVDAGVATGADVGVGWPALAAAAFLAVSPPAVYYSRYFIQETLLATLMLAAVACAQRWLGTRRLRWAVATGVCAGLMQATKASAPIFLLTALLAWWLGRASARRRTGATVERAPMFPWRHVAAAIAAAVLTGAVLYSSFGTHLPGVRDALAAYTQAFARFGAEAPPTGHEKPWWYYLRLFGWHREGGLLWHQVAFSTLALAGFGVAVRRRDAFLRGLAFYALAITATFSLFAYKTPWHAVHLVPGFALLGAAALGALARGRAEQVAAGALALITIFTLYQQTGRVAFLRPADQRNPYAYVHSSFDVLKYRPLAAAAVARSPERPIRVISEEYWPLPWYLRGLPRVGFYLTPPDDCDGALVIASASQADAVRAKLHGVYRESFLGLRPDFVCILFTPEP